MGLKIRVRDSLSRTPKTALLAVATVAGLAIGSAASATPVVLPSIDLGFDADGVAANLQAVLVPFLAAAIAIGFAFFAVKLGVRWIKSWVRG